MTLRVPDGAGAGFDLLARPAAERAIWHAVDTAGEVRTLSALDVRAAALRLAGPIAQLLAPGPGTEGFDAVVVAVSDPLEFLSAFFAVQLAGGVPAPAPALFDSHPVHLRRTLGMIEASRAALVIASASRVALLRRRLGASRSRVVSTLDLASEADLSAVAHGRIPSGDDRPMYVQYTSGSTKDPAPIVVRARHLVAQLAQAAMVYEEGADCVSVTWVPLHHDMGLVTAVLRPLWSGYASVLLQPLDFVRRPRHWLEQLTKWGATHTSAPNFGYALCAAKVDDISGLDLGRLRVARVAGELVRPRSLRAFGTKFALAGFEWHSFAPSYGLAEATLTVTTCRPSEPPREVTVSARGIRRGVVRAAETPDDELVLMSCGAPLPQTTVRIVPLPHSSGQLEACSVGEIWITGPQVIEGDPKHELDGRAGRRTGDIGFLKDGELVLLGRATERFQVHGGNYYCAELEDSVAAACPDVRAGRVAVFATNGEAAALDEVEIVLLAELRAPAGEFTAEQHRAREASARDALRREHGLGVARIRWLDPHTLPVTTSGKLRRLECRDLHLQELHGMAAERRENVDRPRP